METTMRMIRPAILAASVAASALGLLASGAARADTVPAFKGNDTGGIISYALTRDTDVRQLAVDHCARYDKVAKFLGAQRYYGGYISFACRWVPYGSSARPIRARY
jgi:hypothetical protein